MPNQQPEEIKKIHVQLAAKQWDKDGKYLNFRNSIRYDVEIKKKRYPPKAIISIAYNLATNKKLPHNEFAGASEGKWHAHLKNLGFQIHNKLALFPDEVTATKHSEGHRCEVIVNRYERNPKARADCIKHWGTICKVCCIDLSKQYGDMANGFIHVHHLVPLSTIGESYIVDPIKDLLPVCPNCHAMLHLSGLPPDELKKIRKKLKNT